MGCIGDGVSGDRVQAIYAVPADRPDRSATVIGAIRSTYAPRVDWQFNQSAGETGGDVGCTGRSPAGVRDGVPDERARKALIAQFDWDHTEPEHAIAYRFDIVLRGRHATPMERAR